MKLGYTIVYVSDVNAATKFYNDAFGIATRFVHDGGDYAELDTDETALAFARGETRGKRGTGQCVLSNRVPAHICGEYTQNDTGHACQNG